MIVKFEPVAVGHFHVGDDGIDRIFGESFLGRRHIAGLQDPVTLFGQDGGEDADRIRLVINDQDTALFGAGHLASPP